MNITQPTTEEKTMKIEYATKTISKEIIAENDGSFTAMSFTASKNFKTFKGAEKWLAKRGA